MDEWLAQIEAAKTAKAAAAAASKRASIVALQADVDMAAVKAAGQPPSPLQDRIQSTLEAATVTGDIVAGSGSTAALAPFVGVGSE